MTMYVSPPPDHTAFRNWLWRRRLSVRVWWMRVWCDHMPTAWYAISFSDSTEKIGGYMCAHCGKTMQHPSETER